MLQFEFDIRENKINNRQSRGKQLGIAISFLLSAILLYFFNQYFNFLCHGNYFSLILIMLAIYFFGLLLGCKFLYPKEYLIVNSRKLKYKIGWRKKEIKIYLKDVKQIKIINNNMKLFLKNKEEILLDLSHLNEHSISVLKNYLNASD